MSKWNYVHCILDRVDTILQKVEEIAETNFLLHSSSPNVQPQLPPLLEDRLQYLEKQVTIHSLLFTVVSQMQIHFYVLEEAASSTANG